MSSPFPSPTSPTNWETIPSFNAPLFDPSSGNINIPWLHFFNFLAARSSFVPQLSQDSQATQAAITLLQSEVTSLEATITTLQNQIITLQGQVTTLQGQVTLLQTQVTLLQTQVHTLQTQVAVLEARTNELFHQTGTNQTATAVGMAGIAITFTPLHNTRFLFTFDTDTDVSGGGVGASASYAVRFGTGAPPALGAALTGTVVSATSTSSGQTPVGDSLSGILSGLTIGTTYWIDLGISAITSTNVSFTNNATSLIGGTP